MRSLDWRFSIIHRIGHITKWNGECRDDDVLMSSSVAACYEHAYNEAPLVIGYQRFMAAPIQNRKEEKREREN